MSGPLSRRTFLEKSLRGAGLTIALSMASSGCRLIGPESLRKDSTSPYNMNAWIQVIPDETVVASSTSLRWGKGFTPLFR